MGIWEEPLNHLSSYCRNTKQWLAVNYACGKGFLKLLGTSTHRPFSFLCQGQVLSYSGWVCNYTSEIIIMLSVCTEQVVSKWLCIQWQGHLQGLPLLGSMICRLPTISQASWFWQWEKGIWLAYITEKLRGSQAPSWLVLFPAHCLASSITLLLPLCAPAELNLSQVFRLELLHLPSNQQRCCLCFSLHVDWFVLISPPGPYSQK